MKPNLVNYYKNEWEFIYPKEIDNGETYDLFCNACDLLDYDDYHAEILFKDLIRKYPYYIDAYNHLSICFRNQNKLFESFLTAEKSYQIGKELFPKKINVKKIKLQWSTFENRPFLRACQILGLEHQNRKEYDKAIENYDEILNLNEDDNQGVRYLKLECLFHIKDFKSARKLLIKYKDDWSIEFAYGKIVVDIIEDKTENAKKEIEKALKINSFLPNEIVKTKHIKPQPYKIPGEEFYIAGNPVGSIQESFSYWSRNKDIYKNKSIIEFFKKVIQMENK